IFASEKMEWARHYSCKKLLGLLTLYDMIQRKSGYIDSKQLQAIRIVKTRVKNGIPCFEIEWQKPEHYVHAEDEPAGLFVVTVEEESLFQAAYPDVVARYQVEESKVLKKKQKSRKDRPKEKELPNVFDEVSSLLSQMNLKSRCGILPVQDSIADVKTPPEDQTHQRSTESNGLVLAAASGITTVQMPASAPTLPQAASPCSSLQSTLAGSSVQPAQFTKNSGISSSSSVTAGLRLSSIDWEGTFFSAAPAHGGDARDPAADLTACIKHSHPLGHETVRSSSEYSDATQSDQHHSDSADDLVSDDAVRQLQKLSSSERILTASVPSNPLLSEDVMQLEGLKCFKQMKEALNSASCQLNKLVQEGENVLPENCARESSRHIYQDQYKKAGSLAEVMQRDANVSSSASLVLSGQRTKTQHPECEMLPVSQKPGDAGTGCHIKKACTQTTWKTSLKKSVCQNRSSSSEDSDDGNLIKNLIYEQQKKQLNPGQFKKYTKKRSTTNRTNSDSGLLSKGQNKKTSLKKAGNSLSLEISPKPSPVGEGNCFQSPEQLFESCDPGPTQQAESAPLTSAWADSPLPLSERLKRRIKIN
ncbi:PREDICTED: flap endonuclease GEN homolog 1-like, partial [Eurypyga helias]|uniref:flap endonuclease GEN homolog 1-like n=1 Tax=Eurypyga helias TaxID=54383 RepID=UPI0005280E16